MAGVPTLVFEWTLLLRMTSMRISDRSGRLLQIHFSYVQLALRIHNTFQTEKKCT